MEDKIMCDSIQNRAPDATSSAIFKPGMPAKCTWFLEIAFVRKVNVYVCVSTPEAINYYLTTWTSLLHLET